MQSSRKALVAVLEILLVAPHHALFARNHRAGGAPASVGLEEASWDSSVKFVLGKMHLGSQARRESTGVEQPFGPQVVIQVADTDVHKFQESLSTGCGQQFGFILNGTNAFESFSPEGQNQTELTDSCQMLNGTLCSTEAFATAKAVGPGRNMSMATRVSGHGCLPEKCVQGSDLEKLASFMHEQASTQIPGDSMHLKLNVDCSEAGGNTVSV
eukprot:CAMPEP_0194511926 /NCGR_PEP_ID=MMETSP0253-20130528/43741_1 /TAXON_ID=2966 /ORGANISM="Noctiluca scintillans" /LENGTH=212 /DNA_ID=CAMNT_0039355311 /DNA_START=59 /DNA_END=693 /DNA_ORIENTATION=-